MEFNSALYNSLKESEFLLNVDEKQEWSKYRDNYIDAYDNYSMSYREFLIYKQLGKYLSKSIVHKKLNVLDVGSGKLHTAERLIKDTSFVGVYTAIDNIVDANEYSRNILPYVETFEYSNTDILKGDFTSENIYDIVFIDVEPHSHEIEVYEKIKHCLAKSHLCILKHVGFIDLYGSSLADKFMTKYEEEMSDYYGETSGKTIPILSYVRDVFVIFDTHKTTNVRNMLRYDPPYTYVNKDIKQFCRCCSC